jgi:hypothetical protein
MVGLTYPVADVNNPVDPITCWRRDRKFGLVFGFMVGLALVLILGFMSALVPSGHMSMPIIGLIMGIAFGLEKALKCSVTWPTVLAFVQLRCANEGPLRMFRFLEDARHRQILRIAGPVYQFRHARLQKRLAHSFEQ